MSYPVNTIPVRPYSADIALYHDAHVRAFTARTLFNGGQLYRATDGRMLFIMSGNSQSVDVWCSAGAGLNLPVGEMTPAAFATLIGR